MYSKLQVMLFKAVQRKDCCGLCYDFKVFIPCKPKQPFSTLVSLMKGNSKKIPHIFETSNTCYFLEMWQFQSLIFLYRNNIFQNDTITKSILKENLKRKFIFITSLNLMNMIVYLSVIFPDFPFRGNFWSPLHNLWTHFQWEKYK